MTVQENDVSNTTEKLTQKVSHNSPPMDNEVYIEHLEEQNEIVIENELDLDELEEELVQIQRKLTD